MSAVSNYDVLLVIAASFQVACVVAGGIILGIQLLAFPRLVAEPSGSASLRHPREVHYPNSRGLSLMPRN